MTDPAGDAAGLLVLHLWTEPGELIRVRIIRTTDIRSGVSTTSYAGSRDEVLEQVGDWLDSLVTPR